MSFRVGYVAIVGVPNVGKSTLMNALLGQKLSIVTPKPQTTRHKILGVLTGEDYQMIFLDTPGIMKPKYQLQEVMVKAALSAIEDADLILLMVEAREEPRDKEISLVEGIKNATKTIILVINKIDLIKKALLLPLIDRYSKLHEFADIVPISALTGDGLDILLKVIAERLPEGEPFYPPDVLTQHPERFFVSEIIRERIFERYRKEIPYSTAVKIEEFKERPGRKDYIRAIVYVERDPQKAILIGKDGAALKEVGQSARKEIESFLGRPVYLELWVRVREKWRKDTKAIKEFGYRW